MSRLLKLLVPATVVVCFVLTTAAHADTIYYGKDDGVGAGGARPNSDAAAALFDAAIGGFSLTLIDFESASLGLLGGPLVVAPGVTISETGQNPTTAFTARAGIDNSDTTSLGYNTTAGGSQFWRAFPFSNSATGVTLAYSFSSPMDAFGSYLTGTETTVPGSLTVTYVDGGSSTMNIGENAGGGGVLFWGATFTNPITTISFNGGATTGTRDLWGMDDVRVAVPEPSTLLLFGTGLAAVGLRRYRRKP